MATPGTPGPNPTEAERVTGADVRDLDAIDFGIKKTIRYHSRRRASLERRENLINWIVAVTGAAAFAAIVGDADLFAKILTFLVAGISLANVIFSFGSRSRIHQDLYRRFSELAIEVSLLENPTAHDIARLRAKRLAMEADEPHVIDALERL